MKFCPQCGQRLASFDLEEKRRYVPEPEPPLDERNWFRRHLNWTLVLTWLICLPVGVVCVNIFRFTILSTLTISGVSIILGIIAFTCGVLIWWATIWVVKQKGRSLLHLFWILLPLGFIAILCLENKSLTHDASGNSMADYNKAIESDPANADAYYERGDAYDELGEYEKAIADYNKAIKLDPNHALAYFNRAYAYGEIGEYNKAIADYSKAIELNPSDAQAYYNRGLDYHNKGEVPKAVSDLEKCIGLSTDPELTKAAQQGLYEVKNSP